MASTYILVRDEVAGKLRLGRQGRHRLRQSTMLSPVNRRYGGHQANTVRVAVKLRTTVSVSKRTEVLKPEGNRQAQCSGNRVWEFIPNVSSKCCNARCMAHFTSSQDGRVVAARAPMFDASSNRHELRAQLLANWTLHLRIGDGEGEGRTRPVCAAAACKIFVCSRTFLYPDKRCISRSESNSNKNEKAVCVSSWLHSFQDTLEVMPDEGWYMIQQPRKFMVFDMFIRDCEQWPALTTSPCCAHESIVVSRSVPFV
jgi:hypothetical protein